MYEPILILNSIRIIQSTYSQQITIYSGDMKSLPGNFWKERYDGLFSNAQDVSNLILSTENNFHYV